MVDRVLTWRWLVPVTMAVVGLQVILLCALIGLLESALMQLAMLAASEWWMIRDVLKRRW